MQIQELLLSCPYSKIFIQNTFSPTGPNSISSWITMVADPGEVDPDHDPTLKNKNR